MRSSACTLAFVWAPVANPIEDFLAAPADEGTQPQRQRHTACVSETNDMAFGAGEQCGNCAYVDQSGCRRIGRCSGSDSHGVTLRGIARQAHCPPVTYVAVFTRKNEKTPVFPGIFHEVCS